MISLIQHFEADFLWKVSLKILNSEYPENFHRCMIHTVSNQQREFTIIIQVRRLDCLVLFVCLFCYFASCELPVSFSWANDVYSCSSGRYSLYVLSVINSNYIELIFHLFS